MNKTYFAAIIFIGVSVISGCVATSGNVDLNARAIQSKNSAKSSLVYNDKQLQACIIYSYLLQLENRVDPPRVSTIEYACEAQELKYRSSVMANVRPSLQSRKDVLYNTANTSVKNLYSTVLRRLSK